MNTAPLYWSEEGRRSEVVRCYRDHIAARTTFEDVGGCPYCSLTQGERNGAVAAIRATKRRQHAGQGNA